MAKPSQLEQAKSQLVDAILGNQGSLAKKLSAAREDLELSLKHVSLGELSEEVREELEKLAKLVGAAPADDDQPLKSNTKTTDKLDFIKRQLEMRGGQMLKKELLDLAAQEFRCKPSPTFLDAAIKLGKLKRTREGYNVVVACNKKKTRHKDEE